MTKRRRSTNIFDLQVVYRQTLELEALNGQGSIGNISQTSKLQMTDGLYHDIISGAMLSHQLTKRLHELVHPNELCDACRNLSPVRTGKLSADELDSNLSLTGNHIKKCIICDLSGFMGTEKGAVAKRSKVGQFCVAAGVEGSNAQALIRNRVDVTEAGGKKKEKDAPSVSTQMIMQQEVRSNVYASRVHLQLGRIGFDDERLIYFTNDVEELVDRMTIALTALRNALIDVQGAKMGAFAPHVTGFEGLVSTRLRPEEVMGGYSAANDDYKEVIQAINPNTQVFENGADFMSIFKDVLDEDFLKGIAERNLRHTGQLV